MEEYWFTGEFRLSCSYLDRTQIITILLHYSEKRLFKKVYKLSYFIYAHLSIPRSERQCVTPVSL